MDTCNKVSLYQCVTCLRCDYMKCDQLTEEEKNKVYHLEEYQAAGEYDE